MNSGSKGIGINSVSVPSSPLANKNEDPKQTKRTQTKRKGPWQKSKIIWENRSRGSLQLNLDNGPESSLRNIWATGLRDVWPTLIFYRTLVPQASLSQLEVVSGLLGNPEKSHITPFFSKLHKEYLRDSHIHYRREPSIPFLSPGNGLLWEEHKWLLYEESRRLVCLQLEHRDISLWPLHLTSRLIPCGSYFAPTMLLAILSYFYWL